MPLTRSVLGIAYGRLSVGSNWNVFWPNVSNVTVPLNATPLLNTVNTVAIVPAPPEHTVSIVTVRLLLTLTAVLPEPGTVLAITGGAAGGSPVVNGILTGVMNRFTVSFIPDTRSV